MSVILNTANKRVLNLCNKCLCRCIVNSNRARPEALDLAYSEYYDHGASPDNLPVLIAHGLLGSKTNWHSMAKALNKSTAHKVITIDQRGHGESPHHPRVDYDSLSEDIILFLKNRGLPKAVLIGHSMGGRAALLTALTKPEVVAALVVVDISPFTTPLPNPTGSYMDAMLKARWDPQISLAEARKAVDGQLTPSVKDPSMRQFLLTNLVKDGSGVRWRCDLPTLAAGFEANILYSGSLTGSYDGRTLFIGGGQSPYIPQEDHGKIRDLFPNAQFEYIPGASHFVHADKPREFLQVVTAFLNK